MAEKCERCDGPFDEDGEWAGMCYPCFSEVSEQMWWEVVKDLIPTGEPDEYVRIGATCPIGAK